MQHLARGFHEPFSLSLKSIPMCCLWKETHVPLEIYTGLFFLLDIVAFNVDHFQRQYWICYSSATVFVILPRRDLSPTQGCIGVWTLSHGAPGKPPAFFSYTRRFFSAHFFSTFSFCPKYLFIPCCVRAQLHGVLKIVREDSVLCPRLSPGRSSDCFWLCSYGQAAGSILDCLVIRNSLPGRNFQSTLCLGRVWFVPAESDLGSICQTLLLFWA